MKGHSVPATMFTNYRTLTAQLEWGGDRAQLEWGMREQGEYSSLLTVYASMEAMAAG